MVTTQQIYIHQKKENGLIWMIPDLIRNKLKDTQRVLMFYFTKNADDANFILILLLYKYINN